jgi:hypothetical protein
MSGINCVMLEVKASMKPFVVGTIAMLEVMAEWQELNVETIGRACPSGHKA